MVLEPNKAPYVEKGYEIKVKSSEIQLRPIDEIDQNYQALAQPLSEKASFAVNDQASGQQLDFTVEVNESGLVIQPNNEAAAAFANSQRSASIGGGVKAAVEDLGFDVESFSTIFIDLTNIAP